MATSALAIVGRSAALVVGLTVMLLATGCGFTDGEPWATASSTVAVRFDDNGRASDGGVPTADDFLVADLALDLDVTSISFSASSGGGSFDPANPPEGYSLCHNGHCHHDDGRLVDYEDIELELSGATSSVVWTAYVNASAELGPGAPAVTLPSTCDECSLPQGDIGAVTLRVASGTLRATVSDRRTGDRVRLPEPIEVDVALPEFEWTTPIRIPVDGRAKPRVDAELSAVVPVEVLDGLDWTSTDLGEALGASIRDLSSLNVELHRSPF